ncbi:MAG: 16S rRNA (cytosine(1402)-N(4))-methyltransferase [Candidatus Magasanikbacteria bacterium RIFOXYA2_FULL_44_8]|uniref:Ribosomal RNA small subunit methyltransferase H n=1 Tax=Candidatus Magasanikbacteria bacterium RIFOXYA2_FULL_44_8 TaxID=1798696 RepID=A0A1F6NIK2_9BACT|nr:MAG: 16S rRNA (cytosine(1402)-N(4))-methyltransferase [Candidatus Magasanikbacteria bacterium RIFOXYA2_FULL_44_8]
MRHIPVLIKEVIEGLKLKSGDRIVDCTLGDAGHSEEILKIIGPKGRLLGIDADPEAVLRAKQYLYDFGDQVVYERDNFTNLKKILTANKFAPVNGILADLGWSTPQFSERGRGFSFETDEPLNMRYGGELAQGETAANILKNCSEDELAKIFKDFGEEKFAREIATAIVNARDTQPIERTTQLTEIVLQVYRAKLHSDKEIPWVGGTHPATQIFQALRIAVNHELDVVKQFLPQVMEALASGGRLAVITFHSLEDRIVKQYFQKINNKTARMVNKKPITATEEELKNNPRARSAKLRIIEKI